ncbi:MAG: hypothetical protein V9E98_14565 [Candidatus Nanopelagicales bacterium]
MRTIVSALLVALLAGVTPAPVHASAGPPCTVKAINQAVRGEITSKKCTRKWAAGTVITPGTGHKAKFLVKAAKGKRDRTNWALLTRSQLRKACGPGSPVPRRILRRSPCQL